MTACHGELVGNGTVDGNNEEMDGLKCPKGVEKEQNNFHRCRQDLNLRGFPQRIPSIVVKVHDRSLWAVDRSSIRILLLNHSDTTPPFLNFSLDRFTGRIGWIEGGR